MENQLRNKIIELLQAKPSKDIIRKNKSVDELLNEFDVTISKAGVNENTLTNAVDKIVALSVDTNHTSFMNQMYGKLNETAVYGDVLTTLLNTSMYTYEVAPLLTLIEKECIDKLCSYVWGNQKNDGVFTPGGSISNMMGLLLARDNHLKSTKIKGLNAAPKYSIFVSNQAHYSFTKAAIFMGFGKDSVVKIASNKIGQIDKLALQNAIAVEKDKGRIPLMLVGVAGTTFSGVFDDLITLNEIAKANDMWYHVDAVYGGSLMFSRAQQLKFNGIESADSVSWNLHKIMGIPLICASFLTKQQGLLNEAFAADADYLFHDDNDLDLGQKSLQCGRRVDALKLWLAWKQAGEDGFEQRVDSLLNATQTFASQITTHKNLELFCEPQSPIVIFRLVDEKLSLAENNEINKVVRDVLFKQGKFLFNYSSFNDVIYLRCVISDPNITTIEISEIVNEIVITAKQYTKNLNVL